ncbi:unnamed protein product [Calypogeia fissa]
MCKKSVGYCGTTAVLLLYDRRSQNPNNEGLLFSGHEQLPLIRAYQRGPRVPPMAVGVEDLLGADNQKPQVGHFVFRLKLAVSHQPLRVGHFVFRLKLAVSHQPLRVGHFVFRLKLAVSHQPLRVGHELCPITAQLFEPSLW